MSERLFRYIALYSETVPSEAEKKVIQSHFSVKRLRKRQFLLQEGDICRHFGFIVHGAMRQYRTNERGVERIMVLGIEDWWMGDRTSFVFRKPSNTYVQAWEDTELNTITREDFLELIEKSPSFAKMIRALDERSAIATQDRIDGYNTLSSEERYNCFASRNPDMVVRFPQNMIASYLGITKETLSRIRKPDRKSR